MSGENYKVRQYRSDGRKRKIKLNVTAEGLFSEGRRLTRWEYVDQIIAGKSSDGLSACKKEGRYCLSVLSKSGRNFHFEMQHASDRTALLREIFAVGLPTPGVEEGLVQATHNQDEPKAIDIVQAPKRKSKSPRKTGALGNNQFAKLKADIEAQWKNWDNFIMKHRYGEAVGPRVADGIGTK